MEKDQQFATVQQMFLNGSRRKEIIDYLESQGLSGDAANQLANDAYKSVKDQRRAIIDAQHSDEGEFAGMNDSNDKSGGGRIGLGVLFLVGGIVATMVTDRIWYGLMIIGGAMIITGIARMATK
ncbi:MAG: hypothetical protein R2824_20000 [Saprospiraceae bacterium]|nr:hypothetical protein [Lewinella sp.]